MSKGILAQIQYLQIQNENTIQRFTTLFRFFQFGTTFETLANNRGECPCFLISIKHLEYSRLISFRITCSALNSTRYEKVLQHKDHTKDFCRTKTTEYGGKCYQSVSQRLTSCELKSCDLGVYYIMNQQVMSLSHCKLQANKLVSYKPASFWVASLNVVF